MNQLYIVAVNCRYKNIFIKIQSISDLFFKKDEFHKLTA